MVPGDPAASLLVKLIRHEGPPDDPKPMPPKGKLTDADICDGGTLGASRGSDAGGRYLCSRRTQCSERFFEQFWTGPRLKKKRGWMLGCCGG